MIGMAFVRAMELAPKNRNPIHKHCWNRGHKVMPDKKKEDNKLKCRQKNRTARNYSNGPLSFRRYILWP